MQQFLYFLLVVRTIVPVSSSSIIQLSKKQNAWGNPAVFFVVPLLLITKHHTDCSSSSRSRKYCVLATGWSYFTPGFPLLSPLCHVLCPSVPCATCQLVSCCSQHESDFSSWRLCMTRGGQLLIQSLLTPAAVQVCRNCCN